MKKVDVVVGTRPEIIKMYPVYKALMERPDLQVRLISTGQHRELGEQAFRSFGIKPDIDLCVMRPNQSLSGLTASILSNLETVFIQDQPDIVLAHGDTTTSYVAALSAFYHRIPFFHVEAGLRTYRLDSPYPEEFNRQGISRLSTHHFAPTELEKRNLMKDGVYENGITITGSTVHDSIREIQNSQLSRTPLVSVNRKKLSVVTLHRRESGTQNLKNLMEGIRSAALKSKDTTFIYPVHPNPISKKFAHEVFHGIENVELSNPLDYVSFISLLDRADLVITDSGGIQEETSYLGTPTLILRDLSERMDGIDSGTTHIIGTDEARIESEVLRHLSRVPFRLRRNIPAGVRASDIIADKVLNEVCS